MIPYGRQEITESDIAAVREVLLSDFLTQGPVIPRFEHELAQYCRAEWGVAVNSATSALHIACLALGLGPGDRVWTSPNTFVATANCALYCGADVDFVDVDPLTYNLSVEALAAKLQSAERVGRLPTIVIPVHFAGQPCEMSQIASLGERYGFRIIEDASHAVGALYDGQPVGNCRYSDLTVFSFHPVKIITTGEGGFVTTNDRTLYERLNIFRSHGITREPEQMETMPEGPWIYQQIDLGYNYRLTDIQASLGLSQLKRLDNYLERRHCLADRYDQLLAGLPITRPYRNPVHRSALHLYPIQFNTRKARASGFSLLRKAGINVNVHYIPVHTQPYYRKLGFQEGQYPVAENYYSRALSLPLYPSMSNEQQDQVVAKLAAFF